MLDATHREVMHMLERLRQWVEQLEEEGISTATRATADEICRFFDGTARAHHAAEERFVFPSLLDSDDAALVQHVQRLQQDHGWLEEDWLELQPQMRSVVEGRAFDQPRPAAIRGGVSGCGSGSRNAPSCS